MKLKETECKECGYFGESIKGLCRRCYWNGLRKKSAKKAIQTGAMKTKSKKKEINKELDSWFKMQITQIPANCENCNGDLSYHKSAHPKWIIAHILPKRNNQFPEVATHPLNRLFLCPDCHQNYDNGGKDIIKMKVFKIALKRLSKVVEFLTEKQYARLPKYYTEGINEYKKEIRRP